MKLLTVDLKKKFAKIGSQDNVENPLIIATYFICFSDWTFYATAFDPETEVFSGIFSGEEIQWGTISLRELESIRGRAGMKVERNLWFQSIRMSEKLDGLKLTCTYMPDC